MKKILIVAFLLSGCVMVRAESKPEVSNSTTVVHGLVDTKKVYCDVCGKCLTDDKGFTLMGFRSEMQGFHDTDPFIRKQMGPYKTSKTYRICYECWLKNMKVKP